MSDEQAKNTFQGVTLPADAHDWFLTPEGDMELWACFQSRGYMHEAIQKFEEENPGKRLELLESTLNLRFRVVDEDPGGVEATMKQLDDFEGSVVVGGTCE